MSLFCLCTFSKLHTLFFLDSHLQFSALSLFWNFGIAKKANPLLSMPLNLNVQHNTDTLLKSYILRSKCLIIEVTVL